MEFALVLLVLLFFGLSDRSCAVRRRNEAAAEESKVNPT
jgi:hypothetical protein